MSIPTRKVQKKLKSDHSVFRKQKNSKSSLNKQNSSAQDILTLHQTLGNQAVQRLFKSGFIQGKLTIGKPNDKYEQEADRVADEVMRMPEPQVQRQDEEEEMIQTKPIGDQITPLVQRQVEPEEEEEEPVQPGYDQEPEESNPIMESVPTRDAGELGGEEDELIQTKPLAHKPGSMTADLHSKIQSLKGGGQPLSASERAFFEPRFGADFSHVRIHNNSVAANVARSINARAFTQGQDVAFGNLEYTSGTSTGRRLLAHELAHTLQQRTVRSDSNSRIYRKTPKFKPASLSMAEWKRLRGYWKRQTRILALQGRRIYSKREMESYRKSVDYYIKEYEGVMKASEYLAKAMVNVTALKNTIRALNLIAKIKGKLPKKYTPKVDVDITNALSYGPKILRAFLPILIGRSLDIAILNANLNEKYFARDVLMDLKRFGVFRYQSLLKRYLFRTNYNRKKLKKNYNYHRRETAQLRLLKRQTGLHVSEYLDKTYLERKLIFNYVAGPIYNYPAVILKSYKVRPIDLSKSYN